MDILPINQIKYITDIKMKNADIPREDLQGVSGTENINDFESKLQNAINNRDEKALKETCQQLEEVFLQMMYRQMKATIPKSDIFPESIGKEIFDSMLDECLIKEAAKANGIGLSDMMYKQLYKKMK